MLVCLENKLNDINLRSVEDVDHYDSHSNTFMKANVEHFIGAKSE